MATPVMSGLRSAGAAGRQALLNVVVAALCLAVACVAIATQPPTAGTLDPSNLIAFVTTNGHLAVVDPDTLEATVFGTGLQRAIFPAWSSDGNRIAAVVATPGASHVDVIDVAHGAGPTVVLGARDRSPIYLNWSPDDRYLAVLSGAQNAPLALDIVSVEAALAGDPNARTTLSFGQPFYWVWSRTGRSLLVHRDVLRDGALVGLSGVDQFEVAVPLPSPGAFQSPDISESERYLAYATSDANGSRVVVTTNTARGGDGRAVAELAHDGMVAFAWRPAHEQLSVQGATTSGIFTGPVEILDVPSGASRVLTTDTVLASFWSPDGRWLATLGREDGDERVAQAQDLQHVRSHPPLRHVQSRPPLVRLRFYDVDAQTLVEGGALRLSAAFVSQYLPFFDQYSRSHSLWAPDSSAIVLPTFDEETGSTLVVFRVDGTSTDLVPGDMPAWNVR